VVSQMAGLHIAQRMSSSFYVLFLHRIYICQILPIIHVLCTSFELTVVSLICPFFDIFQPFLYSDSIYIFIPSNLYLSYIYIIWVIDSDQHVRLTVCRCCRFLGGNDIRCVEGLAGLSKLQELYIDNQRLPAGDQLQFEQESLNAIAVSSLSCC